MARTSSFIGRIRRIGNDAETNFSFLSTSAYNAASPAATTAAISDQALFDQALDASGYAETAIEGVLLTFERTCHQFWGIVAKIRPTYDEDILNTTALELWTHDSVAVAWTLRRRILLQNPFVGVVSDRAKFFDLRLSVPLENIDKVWVTMAPDGADTPTMRFIACHAFGQCHTIIVTPGSCADDPDIDCINPVPCEDDVDSCLDGPLDCHDFGAEACDVPPFDWPGLGPDSPGGGPLPSAPPDFPLVDLCDPVALEAFRDSMTPDQRAYFDELLSEIELPCLDSEDGEPSEIAPSNLGGTQDNPIATPLVNQPPEVYVDPETLEPAADPRADEAGEDDLPEVFSPTDRFASPEYIAFFFAGGAPTGAATPSTPGTFKAWFLSHLATLGAYEAEIISAYAAKDEEIIIPDNGTITPQTGIRLNFAGAVVGTIVNVRIIEFDLGGPIVGSSQVLFDALSMSGDGFPATVGPIDQTTGQFANEVPVAGNPYYKLSRDASIIGMVNNLDIFFNFIGAIGTGDGLNWGCGLMVRIIAIPPSGTVVVTGGVY